MTGSLPKPISTRPKIGLALGGGSLKGFAHIGVIQVLEENNIPIDLITGTSIGSAIGAIYATGSYTAKRLEQILLSVNLKAVLPMRPNLMGFTNGRDYQELVRLMTQNKTFADTKIPFKAVAVDLLSGERVVLDKGSLAVAVRASSSIPGFFNPVEINDMMLVDGYLLDNCPDKLVREMGADIVFAINLSSKPYETDPSNVFEVMSCALDIMVRNQPIVYSDLVLRPLADIYMHNMDFHKIEDCIFWGRECAKAHLLKMKSIIEGWQPFDEEI